MFMNGQFLNHTVDTPAVSVPFSSTVHTCYFDHRSGALTAYKKIHRDTTNASESFYCRKPVLDVPDRELSFDELSLRLQYNRAIGMYESVHGRVNRFNKDENSKLITGIRDILISSRDRTKDQLDKFLSDDDIDQYISDREDSRKSALYAKLRRFGRKAYYNRPKWQWWFTVTYDDKLFSSEDEWLETFKKCLANLVTNHGLKFQGVFERGEVGDRLHFHGFVHIPDGAGFHHKLYTVRRHSDKCNRWKVFLESDYFKKRFGNNEWEDIPSDAAFRDDIAYMTKYTTKAPVAFYYSRYLPSECVSFIQYDDTYFAFDEVSQKWLVSSFDCLSKSSFVPLKECYLRPPGFNLFVT